MIKDRVALDLPYYDGLLAGHYRKEPGYASRRAEGTDDWLLIATLDGTGRFGTSGYDLVAAPGSLVLITPGTPHDYGIARGADDWEILWVHFHPPADWLPWLEWPEVVDGIRWLELQDAPWDATVDAFWTVLKLSVSSRLRRLELAMNGLERLLLLAHEQIPSGAESSAFRTRELVDYIHSHLAEPHTLESLSERLHLSVSRFSHLFRDEIGMAPLQYILLQRIRRATQLLERTTMTISEIAIHVGMDPYAFSSRFRAETGVSPRAYRNAHRRTTLAF